MPTVPPPPHRNERSTDPDAAPPLARAGSLLGAGALAALLGSVPAAVRVGSHAGGLFLAWTVLGACALVPMVVALAFARSARDGARTVVGDDAPLVTWGIATWAMTTFLALAAFGALLRATTHHHGLAGVTFALGGLVIALALALFVRRLMQMARGADAWGRAALVSTILAALACAVLVVVVRVARAGGGTDIPSATVVDVLAFAIATGALSRPAFARVAWLALGGLPLALGVLALGWALLSREPALVETIHAHAPLFAPAAERMAAFAAPR